MSEKRPVFLSVISWLSFLGEGFGLLLLVLSLLFKGQQDTQRIIHISDFDEASELPEYTQSFLQSLTEFWLIQQDRFFILHFSRIILLSISLFGVYKMYQMMKKGFPIYVIAQILLVLIPFLFVMQNPIGQLIGAFQFVVVFTFIILYATQLKQLR